jgi:hypothetical protein
MSALFWLELQAPYLSQGSLEMVRAAVNPLDHYYVHHAGSCERAFPLNNDVRLAMHYTASAPVLTYTGSG